MSLSIEDFFEAYKENEFKQIKLTTWKGGGDGTINLRGLPYADIKRFQALSQKITNNKAMDILSAGGALESLSEKALDNIADNLGVGEDFLLKKAICDDFGEPFFKDDAVFKKWKNGVRGAVVNEIIVHIECMNELYGGFENMEEVIESYKKK